MNLERGATRRVEALTNQVISNYRSTLPTVRERQWRTAQQHLQRADAGTGQHVAQGSVSLLRRAPAPHRRRSRELRRRNAAASRHFTEAVSAFREAAELRQDWPDPASGWRGRSSTVSRISIARLTPSSGGEPRLHDRRSRDGPARRRLPRAATACGGPRGNSRICRRSSITCSGRATPTVERTSSTKRFRHFPASRRTSADAWCARPDRRTSGRAREQHVEDRPQLPWPLPSRPPLNAIARATRWVSVSPIDPILPATSLIVLVPRRHDAYAAALRVPVASAVSAHRS